MSESTPALNSQHDAESSLLTDAINGDPAAFSALYERYLAVVYRYIYMRIGNSQEAEDLTEEVFVRAWQALPRYRIGEFPFTSWLYRVAHNLVVDHHRKRRPGSLPDNGDFLSVFDEELHPEKVLERSQQHDALMAAIEQLGEDEQNVIVLRFVQGLSHREVASIIDKSEEACRVIQHRALAALLGILRRLEL